MAEIILPPEEEQEETPQEPELNIDKPTENSKVITIEFEAKKTAQVSTKDTNQQLYTTDTDAWFEFKETSLEGANGTYSVVFRNRHDGSIFQRTGDVVNGIAYYKIPHQEIRHAGAWRGQLVYTLENGNTTAREFGYDVKGHILDGKDVREIVVEDFETLMSQLKSMKDNAEQELANLTQELRSTTDTAEQNETDRQAFFDDLVEDIDELQTNYQELLDTGVLQTNINEKLEELEEEYAPKLNEVTAQLAQTQTNKADITYVDTLMSNITDGSPKELFYSIGALNNKYPNGAVGPMLVFDTSFEDGAHSFIWDGDSWVDVGIYQGSGVKDNEVTNSKLSDEIVFKGYPFDSSVNPPENMRKAILDVSIYGADKNKCYSISTLQKNINGDDYSNRYVIFLYEITDGQFGNLVSTFTEDNYVPTSTIEVIKLSGVIKADITIKWSELPDETSITGIPHSSGGLHPLTFVNQKDLEEITNSWESYLTTANEGWAI